MTLPTSGSISIDDIKAELGITGELSLLDQRVRDLAGIQSGSVTLPNDFYGKSARTVRLVITSYETIQMGMGGWKRGRPVPPACPSTSRPAARTSSSR